MNHILHSDLIACEERRRQDQRRGIAVVMLRVAASSCADIEQAMYGHGDAIIGNSTADGRGDGIGSGLGSADGRQSIVPRCIGYGTGDGEGGIVVAGVGMGAGMGVGWGKGNGTGEQRYPCESELSNAEREIRTGLDVQRSGRM